MQLGDIVLSWIKTGIFYAVDLFWHLIDSIGSNFKIFFFVNFILVLAITYFMFPVLGYSPRSDKARRKDDD